MILPLFLFAPCLSALMISCCEYFLITVKLIMKGILCGNKIQNVPIFRLKSAKGQYIMANLAFVESVYRREVRGMGIEEFVVQ